MRRWGVQGRVAAAAWLVFAAPSALSPMALARSEEGLPEPRIVDPAAREVTIQGQVVDPTTFLREGRYSAELTDETYVRVDQGLAPLAILELGTGLLYVLLPEQLDKDPNEAVYDYVGQWVEVKGYLFERAGARGLVAISAHPLRAGKQSSN